MEEISIICPFCDKGSVRSFFFPKTKRFVKAEWGGSKPAVKVKEEKYEILEDCSNCGKSKKEIQRMLNGKSQSKPKSKEELKKQLEELGLMKKFGGEKK